ncbi:MAG: hypothetical protein JO112_09770 [Planctomycetes bacterium]|nr:hypothetical protein [Planctomycetota bacterium]
MIQTRTEVRCDGCGRTMLGDLGGHANREFNALATVRGKGWRRRWIGKDLQDLCPSCDARSRRSATSRRRPRYGFWMWARKSSAGRDPLTASQSLGLLTRTTSFLGRRGRWILKTVRRLGQLEKPPRPSATAGRVVSSTSAWFTLTAAARGGQRAVWVACSPIHFTPPGTLEPKANGQRPERRTVHFPRHGLAVRSNSRRIHLPVLAAER